MFCTHCGRQIEEGAKFCTHCGARVEPANAGPRPEPVVQAASAGWEQPNAMDEEPPYEEDQDAVIIKRTPAWKIILVGVLDLVLLGVVGAEAFFLFLA